MAFEWMLQFDCGLGSVIIYFLSSSGFFFLDSEGAKKKSAEGLWKCSEKDFMQLDWQPIRSLWISCTNIDYIQAEHERMDGKRCIHTASSLFRMIAMYSIGYIQTEHERLDEKGCIHKLFISHVSKLQTSDQSALICAAR